MAVLPEADSRMSATGTKEAGGIIKVRWKKAATHVSAALSRLWNNDSSWFSWSWFTLSCHGRSTTPACFTMNKIRNTRGQVVWLTMIFQMPCRQQNKTTCLCGAAASSMRDNARERRPLEVEAKILSREPRTLIPHSFKWHGLFQNEEEKKKNHCLHTVGNMSEAGCKTNGAIVSSREHWVSGPALSIPVRRVVMATAQPYVVWSWQVVAQENNTAFSGFCFYHCPTSSTPLNCLQAHLLC